MRYHPHHCLPTRYRQVQNAGKLACTKTVLKFLFKHQASPGLYKGVGDGFKQIKATEGLKGFTLVSTTSIRMFANQYFFSLQGWAPTLIGYSAQGFGKFGFYEIFKDVYRNAAGENEPKFRTLGFAVSSACAEFIADCLLCPWEAVSAPLSKPF